MPPPRVRAPLSALSSLCIASIPPRPSTEALHYLRTLNSRPNITFVRHATHQAQGRANGPKNGPGKRLGAKKTGGLCSHLFVSFHSNFIAEPTSRGICDPGQHHLPTARHQMAPGRELLSRPRPFHLRDAAGLRQVLPRSRQASQATIHWRRVRPQHDASHSSQRRAQAKTRVIRGSAERFARQ